MVYKYNKQEEMFYNLKEDCVFSTACLLTPNNYSFVNFKRPNYKSGPFYSTVVTNNVNNVNKTYNCASQRNNNCYSTQSCNTHNLCLNK